MRRIALGIAVAFATFTVGEYAALILNYITIARKPAALNYGRPSGALPHRGDVNAVAEEEIRELFRQFAIAQTNHDAAFFERVEADNYIVTTRYGQTYTKAQVIALMHTWNKTTRYEHDSLDVQIYGDVAVVKGWLSATDTYEGHTSSVRWQSLYLLTKRTGRWQILSTTQLQ